jgi:hypothetical protein
MHAAPVVPKRRILSALLAAAVFLAVLLAVHGWVRNVPFDAETVHRFILPFRFTPGARDPGFVLTESLEWNITRQFYSLSFLLDYILWGTDAAGYHVTDILLTLVCAVLAWRLAADRLGRATAWIAVLLWLAHASQGWSMFVFTGRNDRLMLLFFLASLLLLDRGMEGGRRGPLAASVTVFALGAFAKEAILSLAPVLFLWSALAAGEGVREAFRRRKWYWAAIAFVCLAYVAARKLLGVANPDDVELASPSVWLLGTGVLYSMLVPWGRLLSPTLSAVCGLVPLGSAPFLRFLPRGTRFGAAAVVISLLPIPLFWVQSSFAWIPTLWLSLAVASAMAALSVRMGLCGWKLWPFPVLLLVLLGVWGHGAGRDRAERYLVMGAAVDLVERDGDRFTIVPALERLPEFREMMAGQDGEALGKTCALISALVSIRFDTEDVVLTGPGGEVLECDPRWR